MTRTEQPSRSRSRKATVGMVHSISGQNTIRVIVNTLVKHPRYGKYVRQRTKLAVHDPTSAARMGDTVEIVPCRRLSKTKAWRLARVIRRGDGD